MILALLVESVRHQRRRKRRTRRKRRLLSPARMRSGKFLPHSLSHLDQLLTTFSASLLPPMHLSQSMPRPLVLHQLCRKFSQQYLKLRKEKSQTERLPPSHPQFHESGISSSRSRHQKHYKGIESSTSKARHTQKARRYRPIMKITAFAPFYRLVFNTETRFRKGMSFTGVYLDGILEGLVRQKELARIYLLPLTGLCVHLQRRFLSVRTTPRST